MLLTKGHFHMKYFVFPLAFVFVAGCLQQETGAGGGVSRGSIPDSSCELRVIGQCLFTNSPVKLGTTARRLPNRKLPFFPTLEELDFVDSSKRRWIAPVATLTDGASIPAMFIRAIGAPTSREFANAATIHDAYCGVGNEKGQAFHTALWQDVHRMFYDALLVGGTPTVKARLMYAAVYLGGPRWPGAKPFAPRARIDPANARRKQSSRSLPALGIPAPVLVAELKRAEKFIAETNPSIAGLEAYLTWREQVVMSEIFQHEAEEDY
jgi:hypothetical protein